jgi:hypothetical protein
MLKLKNNGIWRGETNYCALEIFHLRINFVTNV